MGFDMTDGGIHGRKHMIFADEIKQACPAATLEDRRVYIGKGHGDAIPAQPFHQALDDFRAGQIELVPGAGVETKSCSNSSDSLRRPRAVTVRGAG